LHRSLRATFPRLEWSQTRKRLIEEKVHLETRKARIMKIFGQLVLVKAAKVRCLVKLFDI